MTEKEQKVLNFVRQHDDGRGLPAKSYFYLYLGNQLENGLDAEINEKEFVEAIHSLCEKGYLDKLASPADEGLFVLKQKETPAQGNFYAHILSRFNEADEQTILNTAEKAKIDFVQESGMTTPQRIFQALVLAANVGFGGVPSLTDKQKRFVDALFEKVYNGPKENIYAMLCKEIEENTYDMLKLFCSVGQDRVGMPLLYYILSFAYIDGTISPSVSQRIEEIFSMPLLMYFMHNAPNQMTREDATAQLSDNTKSDSCTEPALKTTTKEQRYKEREQYRQAYAQWEKECETINSTRTQEAKKRIVQIQHTLEDEALKKFDAIQSEHQQAIDKLTEQKRLAEQTLAALDFFKFSEKKVQKEIIKNTQQKIDNENATIADAQKQYDAEVLAASQKAKAQYDRIYNEVCSEINLPVAPKRPEHMHGKGLNNNDLHQDILDGMEPDYLYTASDLIAKVSALENLTEQRVLAFMRQLVDKGEVERLEDGRTPYFQLAD